MRKPGTPIVALVSLLALAWPAAASATFHEMSIRELYPGSVAQPESEYVELQMWAPGQNLVGGHVLKTYNASGGVTSANTFAGDVSGSANQSTILLATAGAEAEFGVSPDTALSPGKLDPAGGAVCWENLDCVSWGSFSGSLPSPAGSPAAAIPDGMALRRTIAPGCATLLEPTDDRDNSAADFAAVFPAPRPNSVAPSERRCPGSGEGGPAAKARRARARRPPADDPAAQARQEVHDRTPTFRFAASEAGSTFQCKLDGKPFRSCRSPFTTKPLAFGHHTFKVRARDDSGKPDPSPASYGFKVAREEIARAQRTWKPSPVRRPMSLVRPMTKSTATRMMPTTLASSITRSDTGSPADLLDQAPKDVAAIQRQKGKEVDHAQGEADHGEERQRRREPELNRLMTDVADADDSGDFFAFLGIEDPGEYALSFL